MDKITNYTEFLNYIKIDENISIIEDNIKEIIKIIRSGNISGTPFNKKYLESFLEYLIKFVAEDLPLKNSRKFIEKFFAVILDLAFMYQEKFNKLIKDFLTEKGDLIIESWDCESEIENVETDSACLLAQFIKSGILFSYLTYNLKQTNQLISNFILLCVSILNSLKIDLDEKEDLNKKLNVRLIFISILVIISENINCFNPDALNCLKNFLNSFELTELKGNNTNNTNNRAAQLERDLEFGNNLDLFALNDNNNDDKNNKSLFIFLKKLISVNIDLMKFHKDDLNFNILFAENVNFFKKIESYLEDNLTKTRQESDFYLGFYQANYLSKIKEIYSLYDSITEKCLAKKNVQINFLVLKPKAIPSLEPEYEFGPIDYVKRKEKVNKAIEIKIKKTKKQAIRNLKKESRILDQERQKVLKRLEYKRKEDQKFANQFVEQQNQEVKKMMTSNPKKRFKLRNGKINKK